MRTTLAVILLIVATGLVPVYGQENQERIVSPEEVDEALRSPIRVPLKIISYPHRVITRGMENGLIKVENDHLRERMRAWTDRLREVGVTGLFGGFGEQTGFGGGATYTIGRTGPQKLTFLGRGTFAHYQEFDVRWTLAAEKAQLDLAGSYQWRPKENFYGLGHSSSTSDHTDFALRQSWFGAEFRADAPKHVRWGVDNKIVATKAVAGQNNLIASTPDVFPDLPGFGSLLRMYSGGAYVDTEFSQGEYGWTGRTHFAASYQRGLGTSHLRYFTYEGQLEGRMPVRKNQSALVGQIALTVNREQSGSDPIPFYLRARIGGSSTMRGYALDRFYGKNVMLMSLDYRYKLHPNMEASIFHDAGQIFDRSNELGWFNWHRNYGISFRFHQNYRTIFRLEYGWSDEGSMFHISFGDRTPQSQRFGGAVRYGTYRR